VLFGPDEQSVLSQNRYALSAWIVLVEFIVASSLWPDGGGMAAEARSVLVSDW
jgi:hypothetical protein